MPKSIEDPYLAFVLAATKKTPDAKEKRQITMPAVLGAGYCLAGSKWGINSKTKDRIKTGLWGYAENIVDSIHNVIVDGELNDKVD